VKSVAGLNFVFNSEALPMDWQHSPPR
jgi:hypothetical protein